VKKILTILLIALTLGATIFTMTRKSRENAAQEDLYLKTSDAAKITQTITIAGDDWLGYLVCRSPIFAQLLAQEGIGVKFEMVFDFSERVKGLADGKYQFATMTLDSYLAQGENNGWPGVILWTIDESFGGDAIVGVPPVTTVDSLNNAKGAFTAGSPSEFLLRSQITHFKLDNLRANLDSFGTDSVEKAYEKLKTGQASFAVLWEPLKTKALQEIPGAKIVIDTTQAQGLIIDIFLASRKVLAESPEVAPKVARAYFTTLHQLMGNPSALAEAALRDINVRDHRKTIEDATEMLKGIRFASLHENTELGGWMAQANPRLETSTVQLSRILENQGTPVNLPNGNPNAILFRKTAQELSESGTIQRVVNEKPRLSELYRPLSASEWATLAKKVKGTLLDTPIFFRPGQSEIPEEIQNELKEAAPKLSHYPSYRIIVEAHSYGNDPETDQGLSEERAAEVKRFLVWDCQIPEERVLALGKGASETLTRGASENEAAYARRNRRAKVILVGD
jgi:outer membrane protein OmpA-like peptidoglycan-associated protein/ABC-type nitrate/sulfonate/bicarbonate transport system substrate-binding protein